MNQSIPPQKIIKPQRKTTRGTREIQNRQE